MSKSNAKSARKREVVANPHMQSPQQTSVQKKVLKMTPGAIAAADPGRGREPGCQHLQEQPYHSRQPRRQPRRESKSGQKQQQGGRILEGKPEQGQQRQAGQRQAQRQLSDRSQEQVPPRLHPKALSTGTWVRRCSFVSSFLPICGWEAAEGLPLASALRWTRIGRKDRPINMMDF